jgi:hypothetical protein
MDDMRERIAKAISPGAMLGKPGDVSDINKAEYLRLQAEARRKADAVLAVMREPTDAMVAAYLARYPLAEIPYGQVVEDYQAMIDTALEVSDE